SAFYKKIHQIWDFSLFSCPNDIPVVKLYMRKKQFIRLLKKYRQGKATKKECKFIESYYDQFEAEHGMENWLNEEEKGRLKREIKTGIEKSILPRELKGVKRKRSPAIIKIAAAIAVLMVLGIGFYELQDRTQTEP